MTEKKMKRFNVLLDDNLIKNLSKQAKIEHRTLSGMILRQYLKR